MKKRTKYNPYRTNGLPGSHVIFTLNKIRKIADSVFDMNDSYWEYSDGNVWHVGISKAINQGNAEEFIVRATSGQVRVKLVEGIGTQSKQGG